MTKLGSFSAFLRTKNQQIAREEARDRRCAFGFCPFDGAYYVGPPADIRTWMIHVEDFSS